jgi:hypothetical protein
MSAARVSKQQAMFSLIENWSKSGVGVQEFCKSQGLAYCVFHYWRKKYEQGDLPAAEETSVIPVELDHGHDREAVAELVFPDGRRLNFYKDVDAGFLRTLLA